MCGIIGYKGSRNPGEIIINALKNLEYRGYDSWGATIKNNSLLTQKQIGSIGETKKIILPKGNMGIGHTRWATTGKVTKNNAHPHLSQNNKISVIHNGIIENYQNLKKELIHEGYKFKSETDTEVIPHLIEKYMKNDSFYNAFKKTIKRLKGNYAIVAINKDSDDLIGAKHGSPLVLGINNNEYFLASDVTAFLEHTKKVVFLEDNDIVRINNNYHINNKRKEIEINWNLESAKKGNYKHFMMKEIMEQPETIKKAIIQPNLSEAIKLIKNKDIYFVGCGSSYHAALIASNLFNTISHKKNQVIIGSEFNTYKDIIDKNSIIIAISQSGETSDLLEAVKIAKEKGVKVLSITNVIGSSLTRISNLNLMMNSGPEICVLSTKTFTSQLVILTLLAYSIIDKDIKLILEDIANKLTKMFTKINLNNIKRLAKKIKLNNNMFVIGRGINYPIALESALKIKEVSYIHTEGFAGGELKHGTIALIENNIPCICLFGNDNKKHEIFSNANEIKSRGGYIIGIGPENNSVFDYFLKVDDNKISIQQLITIQLLSYYLALERGCNPDKPRNLAKSVTVK
jgi:glutamine---fructose-6-phosphate transaminase (isomerizing)